MNKVLNYFTNKAMCAVFVILGAASACAEVITNKLYDAVNTDVEVGYEIKGLADGRETAVVFTKDSYDISWTVPAKLESVQFLVVGGGGGGGGGAVGGVAGAGGGGGGVVTGGVMSFSEGDKIKINVGAGGSGGTKSGGNKEGITGKGASGSESVFTVNDVVYITAYGGGGDGGYKSNGVQGGSNSGGRRKLDTKTNPEPQPLPMKGMVSDEAKDFCYDVTPYGYPGGNAYNDGSKGAGGGGGATGPGLSETRKSSKIRSGAGGPGLESEITGEKLTYGSGGGGGASKDVRDDSVLGSGINETGYAYEGGGHGAVVTVDPGDGTPNQGGGGGGGSGNSNTSTGGGNGGSGIVVFRYVEPVTAVAQIGDTEYASLGAALEAATAGAMITVLNDIATDAAFVITKKVTIDLNGKTIAATQADTEGNGVFWVKAGGELTLNGEGTINGVGGNPYNMAIWANGGKVTINGGTYTNVGAQDSGPDGDHFDLIYVKNGGDVEINGGTFKCQTPKWTLNSNDIQKGTIVVKGGTFYQFNPSDCTTEGAATNFCADGYAAELNNEGYYVVAKLAIAPNGTTEVTAETSEEAAGKVAILVPGAMKDAVTADKYAEYFVKSAKYNETTGKYTVTAALNPDVVKPVIAETEGDTTKEAFVIDAEGNVTLNINNKKPGLYYGVQVLAELGADPVAVVPETNGSLLVPAENLPDGNAAFFKVVVDFAPIPEAE